MASTSKCPYCGSAVRSDRIACPNCGAPNELYVVDTPRTVFQPKTIEELQEYCAERGMPLLRMRFFIGENFKEPRAFGIYRDGKNVVVYKNKADGSRSVRYQGPNEKRAVNELYQKLLQECHNRGIYPDGKPVAQGKKKPERSGKNLWSCWWFRLLTILFILSLLVLIFGGDAHEHDGYYQVDDSGIYYHYGSDWYYSDYDDDWYAVDAAPAENYTDYLLGEDWNSDWGVGNFRESDAWADMYAASGGSSAVADSSDWDWDSWDSNDTDWDSDW